MPKKDKDLLDKDPKAYAKKVIKRMERSKDEEQYGKMSDDKYEDLKEKRGEFKASETKRMKVGSSAKKKKEARKTLLKRMLDKE